MSKFIKKVSEVRNSLFNYYQNHTSGYRYGTAQLKRKLRIHSKHWTMYPKNIKPYDQTGIFLPLEDYERKMKVIDLKRTGRGRPKKGQGKKAKLREKEAAKKAASATGDKK